jgi:fumarate reductase flavoprotein subunit
VPIKDRKPGDFPFTIPVLIVGSGGCGLSAALAAADAGIAVLVVERDATPFGTTAMSTGLIPAAGTPEQAAQGITDTPALFAADIQTKASGGADQAVVDRLAAESAETVAWLRDRHGVPLTLVEGFLYPGHSVRRMYGTPNRVGAELMARLQDAAAAAGVDILTQATVGTLYRDDDRITGISVVRPDGSEEAIGCETLILACSGFGGDAAMVAHYLPDMRDAVLHGHPGNKGDAVRWGRELGAAVADIDAYQGHGGFAVGHAVTINWPTITEGGFQVNGYGSRFSNEAKGYSEQAVKVLAQPGHVAWTIFDGRIAKVMEQFDDYKQAVTAGAIVEAATVAELALRIRVPAEALETSFAEVAHLRESGAADAFGRRFNPSAPALAAPFHAVKVTGALYHTQGGLQIDSDARVLRPDGTPFPNLFAGGGAARGVSGSGATGYIAGNGMLTATTLGKIAGRVAAAQLSAGAPHP